jgi:hypothetical protein
MERTPPHQTGSNDFADRLPLPTHARGVLTLAMASLRAGPAADTVKEMLGGQGADPALLQLFRLIASLSPAPDALLQARHIALIQTTHAEDGLLLVLQPETPSSHSLFEACQRSEPQSYRGRSIHSLAESPLRVCAIEEDLVVVGREALVKNCIDTHESAAADGPAIAPHLKHLKRPEPILFVYGLPALYRDIKAPGSGKSSLRRARAIQGWLSLNRSEFEGAVEIHADGAEALTGRFNDLRGEQMTPLTLSEDGRVMTVAIPPTPFVSSPAEELQSRALLKSLYFGLDAIDYAEAVAQGANAPWMNFHVEGDPYSIFINFEFRDRSQIERFEKNELPKGFRLAPLRILQEDTSSYFLVLNVYQSSGELVSGARAEWSVFVEDPITGQPRFLVVQAAAADMSADPVNLLTNPEPVTHELCDGRIVSHVGVAGPDGTEERSYFSSRIVWPQKPATPVAFAREFVAANDYIHWGHGVCDHTLYNASEHNRDGIKIPDEEIEIEDESRWKQYIHPAPKHSYVYLNPLELVISAWWNLDADYLDITEKHRQTLIKFKNNFYPGMVLDIAEKAISGDGDALASYAIPNTTPSVYFNFRITDLAGFASLVQPPNNTSLRAIRILEDETTDAHYLTLRISHAENAFEGPRAEWITYVETADRRPAVLMLDLQTREVTVDPLHLLRLPGVVHHELADNTLRSRLESTDLCFRSSIHVSETQEVLPDRDWVESGDWIYWRNGVRDKVFYDGGTMAAPVARLDPRHVVIEENQTPWRAFVSPEPSSIFLRTSPQDYASNPWHNVRPRST